MRPLSANRLGHTLAALSAAAICSAALALPAPSAPPTPTAGKQDTAGKAPAGYYRSYHKQRIDLAFDGTRMALRAADEPTVLAALAAANLPKASVRAHAIRGWWVAELPRALTAAEAEAAVATLAAQPGVEFASPVFVNDYGPLWMTRSVIVGRLTINNRNAAVPGGAPDAHPITLLDPTARLTRPDWMPGVDTFEVTSRNGFEVLALTNTLAADPQIRFAESDMVMCGRSHGAPLPNDPEFNVQWDKHNTGQSSGLVDFDMDGPEAWTVTTGSNAVIVLVIDNGVQQNHPDLNLGPAMDFTSDGGDGGPFNGCDDHGTAVAGCISAIINNNTGVAGIAPTCRVASARPVISNVPCDGMWTYQISWMGNAIDWASTIGARVTNNSNGFDQSATVDTAYATTYAAGVVHFASNGNDGVNTIGYPASAAGVNGVASFDRNGNRAGSSQYGPGTDFSGPGVAIRTTDRTGSNGYANGDYATVNGTSFASPNAAGVAALIISLNPGFTPAQTEAALAASCTDLYAAGFDDDSGWGLVNAANAVGAVDIQCPGDFVLDNTPDQCGRSVSFEYTTAGLNPTVECRVGGNLITSPHFFPVGVSTVTCTATVGARSDDCSFTVTINDAQAPVITCPADIVRNNDPGQCGASVSFNPTVNENCPGDSVVCRIGAQVITSPHFFDVGMTTVTCTVTDGAGNSDDCSFNVTVNDNEPPVVTASDAVVQLDEFGNATLTPATFQASATDNCQSVACPILLSLSQSVFLCPPVNVPINVTVFGQDCHGNTGQRVVTVTFPDPDCNENGQADICDILSGYSNDCDNNRVPDECQCVWDNGEPPDTVVGVNAQVSSFGHGAGPGLKVADDMYLCPGRMHNIFFFSGEMLTNTPPDLRKARLELFEDCDGLPAGDPILTLESTDWEEIAGPTPDGFYLVRFDFDLCGERLWLEGGRAYWWSLIGLGTCLGDDYSSWVVIPTPITGRPPVKADGLDPYPCYPTQFNPWVTLDECCIGCVNMSYRVVGTSCPIIWDNGPALTGPAANGVLSENLSPTQLWRGADDFVVKPCEDVTICLIDAWIWSDCNPIHGFLEFYRNDCRKPGELFARLTDPEVIQTGYSAILDGRIRDGYVLRFEPPDFVLPGNQTWWISAGADRTGSQVSRTYFAHAFRCDRTCPRTGFLSQSAVPPLPLFWQDAGPDLAFRIAVKAPDEPVMVITPDPAGVTPVCPPDINGNGIVSLQDLFDFLAAYFSNNPQADINGSASISVQDIFDYLAAYFAGCP